MPGTSFDPLVQLDGMWTTQLAERYLPIPGMPATKYECVDGYLITSPYGDTASGYAMLELAFRLRENAEAAGYRVYPTVNVEFSPQRWIQPDLAILNPAIKRTTWVPAKDVLLVGEFVSPSSRRRDRFDKPALCAREGIPYYLRVEVDGPDSIEIELLKLAGNRYVSAARAGAGQEFRTEAPFPIAFDPAVLLEP